MTLAALSLTVYACLPDPARVQASRLLDELAEAHATLADAVHNGTPVGRSGMCSAIGGVDTRLTGEPSLVDLRPTWPALRAATDDLLAVCGQVRLLETPAPDSAAVRQAHRRWRAGAEHELRRACTRLKQAAESLGRPGPECNPEPAALVQNV
jgi:hypothetical protein